jgi:CRP-like cAMP-binding protein
VSATILKTYFDKYYKAPLNVWSQFYEKCEIVAFDKEEILKQPNSKERFFYFILQGSAGTFLWRENNFVCLDFAFEKSFFGDYMSLLIDERTPLQTMTLEKSEMLRISKQDFFELGKKPIGQVILRVAAEASFIDKQKQQIDLLTKPAQQRYSELVQKFPEITQRVSQKYIASYLGITPQSLSRLKSITPH